MGPKHSYEYSFADNDSAERVCSSSTTAATLVTNLVKRSRSRYGAPDLLFVQVCA